MRKKWWLGVLCGLAACFAAFGLVSCGQLDGSSELTDKVFEYRSYRDGYAIVGMTEYGYRQPNVTIPEEFNGKPVLRIARTAFESNRFMRKLTISENVRVIEEFAFTGCYKLLEVCNRSPYITEEVENGKLWEQAENIYTPKSGATKFSVLNGGYVVYTDGTDRLLVGYEGTEKDLVVPNEITEIYSYAFFDDDDITSITLGNSVNRVGIGAFSDCDNLQYAEKDGLLYLGTEENDYYCLVGVATEGVTAATIEGSCRLIAAEAFYQQSSLESVVIPDGVKGIGAYAFYYCRALVSVTVPEGVKRIEKKTFSGCEALTGVTLPDSVTSIGNEAFNGCKRLTGVNIPDGMESVGKTAFYNCGLTDVTIPESVTSIEQEAFNACYTLASVTIGRGVKQIGYRAFGSCYGLTSVYYTGSASDWGEVQIAESNEALTGATVYFYVENEADVPTDGRKYWRYVDGVPTVWGV